MAPSTRTRLKFNPRLLCTLLGCAPEQAVGVVARGAFHLRHDRSTPCLDGGVSLATTPKGGYSTSWVPIKFSQGVFATESASLARTVLFRFVSVSKNECVGIVSLAFGCKSTSHFRMATSSWSSRQTSSPRGYALNRLL